MHPLTLNLSAHVREMVLARTPSPFAHVNGLYSEPAQIDWLLETFPTELFVRAASSAWSLQADGTYTSMVTLFSIQDTRKDSGPWRSLERFIALRAAGMERY